MQKPVSATNYKHICLVALVASVVFM